MVSMAALLSVALWPVRSRGRKKKRKSKARQERRKKEGKDVTHRVPPRMATRQGTTKECP